MIVTKGKNICYDRGMGQHCSFDFCPLMKQTLLSERNSYTFGDKGKRASFIFLSHREKGISFFKSERVKGKTEFWFRNTQQHYFCIS